MVDLVLEGLSNWPENSPSLLSPLLQEEGSDTLLLLSHSLGVKPTTQTGVLLAASGPTESGIDCAVRQRPSGTASPRLPTPVIFTSIYWPRSPHSTGLELLLPAGLPTDHGPILVWVISQHVDPNDLPCEVCSVSFRLSCLLLMPTRPHQAPSSCPQRGPPCHSVKSPNPSPAKLSLSLPFSWAMSLGFAPNPPKIILTMQ